MEWMMGRQGVHGDPARLGEPARRSERAGAVTGDADETVEALSTPPPDGAVGATPVSSLLRTECVRLLREASIGRIGFVVDGWPVVVPVNYAVDGDAIVFRTDPGAKLQALFRAPKVAFEVDSFDRLYKGGWSVLVHGVAEEVGPDERERLAATLRLSPWAAGPKSHWVRVPVLQITGRRLPRAWAYPGPIPSE